MPPGKVSGYLLDNNGMVCGKLPKGALMVVSRPKVVVLLVSD